jgi:hypothetical protein
MVDLVGCRDYGAELLVAKPLYIAGLEIFPDSAETVASFFAIADAPIAPGGEVECRLDSSSTAVAGFMPAASRLSLRDRARSATPRALR